PFGVAVPAPSGVAVPAPNGVAVPPPANGIGPPPPAVPFSPSAATPQGGFPSSPAIQQNNYVSPGTSPVPMPRGAPPRVELQQPEPAAPAPDARSSAPQTQE